MSSAATSAEETETACQFRPTATFAVEGPTLLDGRMWEQVTPVSKCSAVVELPENKHGAWQAAENGQALAWLSRGSTEALPAGNRSLELSQNLSQRSKLEGWRSRDIATATETATGLFQAEYRAFSADLSAALVMPPNATALAPNVPERTPYVRDDTSGQFIPLLNAEDITSSEAFGGATTIEFAGANASLADVVIYSGVPLIAAAEGAGLYEWTANSAPPDRLRLISVLPDGKDSSNPSLGGEYDAGGHNDTRNAVSSDGSVIWSGEDSAGHTHLYMWDAKTGETVQVDQAHGIAEPTELESLAFQAGTPDGSRVFFTAAANLTSDATTSPEASDLYVYEAESNTLRDLTADLNAGEYANVQGRVLGISTNGNRVYFVATGVLTGHANEQGAVATAKEDNLYVVEKTEDGWMPPTFIATLSPEDQPDWLGLNGSGLGHMTVRVSGDGEYLAFMSSNDLVGYSPIDAVSEQPDEEVYLYNADSSRLICPSCSSSGRPPIGMLDTTNSIGAPPLVDRYGVWKGHWLAANIPGWVEPAFTETPYQPRYLADSGRLFFNTSASLVPQDSDGTWDVYEYEPTDVGSCTVDSSTFEPGLDGCTALVSTGTSGAESAFVDASSDGNDVFFATIAEITPQDRDGTLDIYDAHVCTSELPCVQEPAASPTSCTNIEGCRATSTPQRIEWGPPSSATFFGPANLKPAASTDGKASAQRRRGRALKPCAASRAKRHKLQACKRKAGRRQSRSTVRTGRAGEGR
ncbi:MAG: hypothetical protein WB698_14315 [Solirubrobacteraceae bacterium]